MAAPDRVPCQHGIQEARRESQNRWRKACLARDLEILNAVLRDQIQGPVGNSQGFERVGSPLESTRTKATMLLLMMPIPFVSDSTQTVNGYGLAVMRIPYFPLGNPCNKSSQSVSYESHHVEHPSQTRCQAKWKEVGITGPRSEYCHRDEPLNALAPFLHSQINHPIQFLAQRYRSTHGSSLQKRHPQLRR